MKSVPWQDYSSWRKYGIDRRYENRNPKSLQKGKRKDRSWYRKGQREGWLKKFPFNRKYRKYSFYKWKEIGLKRDYDLRNPCSLSLSKKLEERSWYVKGRDSKWLSKFPFKRKRVELITKKVEWVAYGLKRKYQFKNATSLSQSEDSNERYWYSKGVREKWLEDFPLNRKKRRDGELNNWESYIKILEEIVQENGGEFPSQSGFVNMGYSAVSSAATKYYGGLSAVRERMGYNEQTCRRLARELEGILRRAA